VAVYPGDVSTVGGLVTDERARVLREDGSAIERLYAVGSSAASVMGRVYPASGCSVGSAAIFGFVAAGDVAAGDTAAGDTAAGDIKAGDTAAGDIKAGDTAQLAPESDPEHRR
jgi:3-oxosteroid 1-dehydrogenase